MKFWERIRLYFYKRKLKEKVGLQKPVHRITNLSDAKYVGIVYDSTNPDNDIIITKFAEHLRGLGKTVEIMGFVNDKKIDHKADIIVFNKTKLSWYGAPNDERVEAFTAKRFDLLIAAFNHENRALEYIACTSQAAWRVGSYTPEKTDCYDLMVNTAGKNDLKYFLEQAEYYLNEIKYN